MPEEILVSELSVAGRQFLYVETVHGEDTCGRQFYFDVVAQDHSKDSVDIPALLGSPAILQLKSPLGGVWLIHGVVMEASRSTRGGWQIYELRIAPETAPLTLGRDSWAYREMSIPDIVKDVLDSAGIPADHTEWKLTGDHAVRHYTAQLAESDWDFIERLLADDGITYWFAYGDSETKIVFSDSSPSADAVDGDDTFRVIGSGGLVADADVVFDVTRAARVSTDKVALSAYDYTKPKSKLKAEAGKGTRELYDWPGGFITNADGKKRAQLWLDALLATNVVVAGRTQSTRIRPGLQLTTKEHALDSLNATWFCLSVTVHAERGRKAEAAGLTVEWTAIPAATPFRNQPVGARRVGGPQTGIMCGPSGKDLHTDDIGRIRVQFYWDRDGKKDDKASTWMRVGQFAIGQSMVRPRVGWDLLVEHHDGDVDEPFVTSHLYDGEHPVPYALPGNKTRTAWQTATTGGGAGANEMRFEDKKGSEEMFLNASKDMAVTVGDCKTKSVGVNHTHEIGSNHQVQIGTNHDMGIVADQKVSIGAAETLTVGANRNAGIAGSMTKSVGAARTLIAVQGCTLDADGGRTLTVGASMIAVSALAVARTVLGSCTMTIGSAWVCAAGKGLANTTVGSSSETVGGAKMQLAPSGVSLGVKGALAETVGGAYINTAGGNVGESGATLSITVGGALLGNSPEILIEAQSEIKIVCGGSSITISSSSIEIKTPSLGSPGATITKDGSAIHHNP